jgi:hypothetical protein
MRAAHAFQGGAAAIFILIQGENRRKPVILPDLAAEKTFISNRFRKNTHARREQNNRTVTGRSFALIRAIAVA